MPVKLYGANSKVIETYAFLDDGSDITLLDEELAKDLGLSGVDETLQIQWTKKIVRTESSLRTDVKISGLKGRERFTLKNVFTIADSELPQQSVDPQILSEKYPHLRGLPLPTLSNAKAQILIGQDHAEFLVGTTVRMGKVGDPIASETKLGWTVHGKTSSPVKAAKISTPAKSSVMCHFRKSKRVDESLHELVKAPRYHRANLVSTGAVRRTEEPPHTSVPDTDSLLATETSSPRLDWNHVGSKDYVADDATKWTDPSMGDGSTRWFRKQTLPRLPKEERSINPASTFASDEAVRPDSEMMTHMKLKSSAATKSFNQLKPRYQSRWSTVVRVIAIQRLFTLRGRSRHFYSVNENNFVGAVSQPARDVKEVTALLESEAANRFSLERLMNNIKTCVGLNLKAEISHKFVLRSTPSEAQHQMNRRPLTHMPIDSYDARPLTPNMMPCSEQAAVRLHNKKLKLRRAVGNLGVLDVRSSSLQAEIQTAPGMSSSDAEELAVQSY